MTYIKVSIGIFLALAASRFIPHPPNFTSLLALSFYVPALFGIRFIPALIISFIITDFFIGFHSVTLFTWGSILIIGLASKYFIESMTKRICGALLGAIIFFVITNFGVWLSGMYPNNIGGLINCYTLAIPFFGYSLTSTLTYSLLIELLYKLSFNKMKKIAVFQKLEREK